MHRFLGRFQSLSLGVALLACAPSQVPNPREVQTPTVSAEQRAAAPLPELELSELERLTTLAELEPHVRDPRAEARAIVAERLGALDQPEAVRLLERLARDRQPAVAASAVLALSSSPSPIAQAALRAVLARRDAEDAQELTTHLRELAGGAGLLALLAYVPSQPKQAWDRQRRIFDEVDALADPRAADALLAFAKRKVHPHFRFRAARALAELGDVRAVAHLAWRLRQDPLRLYSDDYDWELALKRDDNERVTAARLIADIARLHPDKKAELREQAEAALLFWVQELPSPHANGIRALAELESEAGRKLIRAWANPNEPLPGPGQQPPMPEPFVVAQSGLRYIGRLRDESSFPVLLKALRARPRNRDLSMDGLMSAGLAILGMSVRALGVGAAQGLAEWGDPRAIDPLLKYIHEPKENEQARMAACFALPWVLGDHSGSILVEQLARYRSTSKQDLFRRECLLEALAGAGGVDPSKLLPLLDDKAPKQERVQVARALGRAGFAGPVEQALLERAENGRIAMEATLALMLAGKASSAQRALTQLEADDRDELEHRWFNSFGYWPQTALSNGYLFGVIRVAEALSRFEIHERPQSWAKRMLKRQFDSLIYDNGPHSLTQVVLRRRLFDQANASGANARSAALALAYLNEEGCLMALLAAKRVDRSYLEELLAEVRQDRARSSDPER